MKSMSRHASPANLTALCLATCIQISHHCLRALPHTKQERSSVIGQNKSRWCQSEADQWLYLQMLTMKMLIHMITVKAGPLKTLQTPSQIIHIQ